MADTVYISNGPTLNGAVKVSGNGPGQASSSQTTSLSGPGASGQSQLEDVTVGSMPVVNTLTVETNKDGTIGIKTTVADAMPETGPGASSRNSSTSASTGSVSSVGVQTGWVQVGNGYKYYKEDGSGYKTGWHYEYNADGSKIWYYFDEKPDTKEWMATGWRRIVNGAGVLCWYHFRVDEKMSRYWECLDGWWYYFEPRDDAGYLVSDWYILNNEYYYFNTDDDKGYMQIDWLKIRGKWYYFHKTDEKRGMMAHDFLMRHTDGNLYYLQEKSDGSMAVNKTIKDPATGIVYEADDKGVCRPVIRNQINIPEKYLSYYYNHERLISQIIVVNANGKFNWDINNIKKIYANNKTIYEGVSDETGVAPELIAAIHYRESGCKFDTYLHNGQKLGKTTTIKPKGLLFYDFHSAAVHALNSEQSSKGFYLTKDADLVSMMTFAEIYNGTGYTSYRGIPSPYVYSGTNVYTSGKYVSDGIYSPDVVDGQPGVYLLMTTLQSM